MAYKVSSHNSFKKGIKGADPSNKKKILDACDLIQNDPSIGEITTGTLKQCNFVKYSIKDTTPQYRIIYVIYQCITKPEKGLRCVSGVDHADAKELQNCNGYVDFIICGTREMFNNFYSLPLNKLKKYL